MLGRTFLVILFFWALLTVITPILVHMSASAKPLDYYNAGIENDVSESGKVIISLFSRKAFGSITRRISVSAPVPPPDQHPYHHLY
ncbi:hypothetical protein L2E82_17233 [Cichorium intybus]|uniref:Uncharacterized protein n=1 Tax=Cichorium intybus TaxID=13427 RepID=A0ACB9F8C7_CICIN|nr:hypothetical protein L2E82_17233 [Cichorium intybus]